MKRKKIKSILVEKRIATEEEKKHYENIFKQERQKRERDELAGGVVDGCYIRLHDRYEST